MIEDLKPVIGKLALFAKDRMGFEHPPKLFLRKDSENSQKMLGRTAHYDPAEKSITLFISLRHPKDILRSFAHELIHHTQNLRGDLSADKCGDVKSGYAQDNEHMRNMEKEAYLMGNMCFRDWEDSLDDRDLYRIKLAESKFLKENKKMTKRITKQMIKESIEKILNEAPRMGMGYNSKATPSGGFNKPDSSDRIMSFTKKQMADDDEAMDSIGEFFEIMALKNLEPPEKLSLAKHLKTLKEKDPLGAKNLLNLIRKNPNVAGVIAALVSSDPLAGGEDGEDALKEGDCPGCKNPKCDCNKKDKELEEGGNAKTDRYDDNPKLKGGQKNLPDSLQNGIISSADSDSDSEEKKDESKIQTPEQENKLYESRFTPRNNRIFEKLLKEWTK
jgi:hypothetical protein